MAKFFDENWLGKCQLYRYPRVSSNDVQNGNKIGKSECENTANLSSGLTCDFPTLLRKSQIIGFYFTSNRDQNCRIFADKLRELCKKLCKPQTAAGLLIEKSYKKSKCGFKSPGRLRRLLSGNFKKKTQKKEQNSDNGNFSVTSSDSESKSNFQVIVVNLDSETLDRRLFPPVTGASNWWSLATDAHSIKTRLLRTLRIQSLPSLVVVDCQSRAIITSDGRRAMQSDPDGANFPWWPPQPSQVFTGKVLSNDPEYPGEVDLESLEPCVKAILFSANWCPPCRVFTKQLIETYKRLKADGKRLQVILCSSDRSQTSFDQYFSQMPWFAFPLDDHRAHLMTRLYNIHGIPSLLILDEHNQIITRHGRNSVLGDPEGKEFPWYPKPLTELTEFTVQRLREELSLVMFTEGSADDAVFASGVLGKFAEEEFNRCERSMKSKDNLSIKDSLDNNSEQSSDRNGNDTSSCVQHEAGDVCSEESSSDPLQFFFTGEDPICDQVMEVLQLQDAPLPLIAIVDLIGEALYMCEEPDISEDIVRSFVDRFRRGAVAPVQLQPHCAKLCSPAQTVGGIPLNAISMALGMSPSQQSLSSPKVQTEQETTQPDDNQQPQN